MKKVSLWITMCAALVAFVAGFSFANFLNRSGSSGMQAPSPTEPRPDQSAAQQESSTLSDAEITQKLNEAERDPENFAFQKGLGIGLYRYGAVRQDKDIIERAIPVLDRAAKLNPDDFEVLVSLGNAHFDVGYFGKDNSSFGRARSLYLKALEKRPGDIEVRTDVGLTYFLMDPPDHTSAAAEFEKSLSIDQKHEKSLGFLIRSLEALGRDASKHRDTLRAINPRNPALSNSGTEGAVK